MKRIFTAILLILLASIFMGCKAAPEVQTAEIEVTATVVQDSAQEGLDWIFNEPTEPVDVGVVLETGGMVEALIPVEGGTLSATGADGTVFTLEIPADALLSETLIGLTPVTSISNMPFGNEQTYAVQLSPNGLVLQNYAILTITPAIEIPLGEQLVFGYQAQGSDVILAAPVAGSDEIKINLLHFSGVGATKGYWGDIEPARRRLGGDIERRLQNSINEALIRMRQDGKDGDGESIRETFREAFKEYVELVVKPRIATAGESCANGRLALETVNSFVNQAAVLGFNPDDFLAGIDMAALMEKATRACILEEFDICVEEHIIYRMLVVWKAFERQYALLGLPEGAALREARDLTIKCMTFRLEFESTVTADTGDGGFRSGVTSTLILRYDPDKGMILGALAELVNVDFELFLLCGGTSVPGNGTFATLGMSYDLDTGEKDADGDYSNIHVSDIKLVYMPGFTSESGTVNSCDSSAPPGPVGPVPLWTITFMGVHKSEADGSSFIAIDWEMLEGELFAEKEWSLISSDDAGVSDEGSFKLYHAPGE